MRHQADDTRTQEETIRDAGEDSYFPGQNEAFLSVGRQFRTLLAIQSGSLISHSGFSTPWSSPRSPTGRMVVLNCAKYAGTGRTRIRQFICLAAPNIDTQYPTHFRYRQSDGPPAGEGFTMLT